MRDRDRAPLPCMSLCDATQGDNHRDRCRLASLFKATSYAIDAVLRTPVPHPVGRPPCLIARARGTSSLTTHREGLVKISTRWTTRWALLVASLAMIVASCSGSSSNPSLGSTGGGG